MKPSRIWTTGEPCRVTCQGRSAPGVITLASKNGLSLFVSFDGFLAGHVGAAPLA
jgi:hypothetical protein